MSSKEFVIGRTSVTRLRQERWARTLNHPLPRGDTICVHGPPQMSKCSLFTGKDGVVSFFKELDKCWEFTSPPILDMMVTEDSRTVVVTTEEHGIDCATKVPLVHVAATYGT